MVFFPEQFLVTRATPGATQMGGAGPGNALQRKAFSGVTFTASYSAKDSGGFAPSLSCFLQLRKPAFYQMKS